MQASINWPFSQEAFHGKASPSSPFLLSIVRQLVRANDQSVVWSRTKNDHSQQSKTMNAVSYRLTPSSATEHGDYTEAANYSPIVGEQLQLSLLQSFNWAIRTTIQARAHQHRSQRAREHYLSLSLQWAICFWSAPFLLHPCLSRARPVCKLSKLLEE